MTLLTGHDMCLRSCLRFGNCHVPNSFVQSSKQRLLVESECNNLRPCAIKRSALKIKLFFVGHYGHTIAKYADLCHPICTILAQIECAFCKLFPVLNCESLFNCDLYLPLIRCDSKSSLELVSKSQREKYFYVRLQFFPLIRLHLLMTVAEEFGELCCLFLKSVT